MEYIWIVATFFCGFIAKQLKLPVLVGYLLAGFGLHVLGVKPDPSLQTLADLGIELLLFTIGLKLDLKNLFKTEIWLSATTHMASIIAITVINVFLLGLLGLAYFSEVEWQAAAFIGFAVSFSSTVFAVKVLEERGEMRSRHAQVAIGILIIQDVAAVLFVTFANQTSPDIWALALLALPLITSLLFKILQRSGHGELLALSGFFFTLSFSHLFEAVGLAPHLGALVIGILLSGHDKSVELAKSMLRFKDIFLIGFFLSIGFIALPTIDMLLVAVIMTLALPFKAGLFFLLLTKLKLRGRTAFLSALSLANYSEFGLIVCSVAITNNLLDKEWLVIMALAVAFSFIISSLMNMMAHRFYASWHDGIKRMETPVGLLEDQYSQPENATVLVIGMGRVGKGAYKTLDDELDKRVCGIDFLEKRVKKLKADGFNVIMADAEDPDFWRNINLEAIQLILFSLPNHIDILEVNKQIRLSGYAGKTAAVARYEDEEKEMLQAGIDVVFNYYARVGSGFAEQTVHLFEPE